MNEDSKPSDLEEHERSSDCPLELGTYLDFEAWNLDFMFFLAE
jgi:hypothetical protein